MFLAKLVSIFKVISKSDSSASVHHIYYRYVFIRMPFISLIALFPVHPVEPSVITPNHPFSHMIFSHFVSLSYTHNTTQHNLKQTDCLIQHLIAIFILLCKAAALCCLNVPDKRMSIPIDPSALMCLCVCVCVISCQCFAYELLCSAFPVLTRPTNQFIYNM